MKEVVSTISSKHQVTVPADVRRHLGVGAADKIVFVIEDDGVRLKPATQTLASLYGSVPALPDESPDLEREIDEAMQERADRLVRRLERR